MLAATPLLDDVRTQWLVGVLLLLLVTASLLGRLISGQADGTVNVAQVRTFRHRVRTWWMMMSILVASFILGPIGAVVLFFFVSFWALREFITMTPTRGGDHRTLFWVFFAFTPLQYVLIGMNEYSLFSIVIPVYASLFIPARIAISGDEKRFLERSAKIHVGL
ncbi:MAG: phosphatidate cytidylyltransferase, partial [Planctomycetota bacterium]|nr:phosphatidate cytidylyltransferase [Planctomycetota bacterium]